MAAGPEIAFKHMGVFVTDMSAMVDFYCRILGFTVTDRGDLEKGEFVFLSRDPDEHHQIVLASGRPPDGFNTVQQISFRVADLAALRQFHQRLVAEARPGIIPLTHGNAWSVYFPDPDGNRLEVYTDTPWHVEQPLREPLDLSLSDAEILAVTEAFCRRTPGFRSRREWRAEMARKMGRPEAAE